MNKKLPTSTAPVNKKFHIVTKLPATHNQKLQPPQPHHKKPIPTNPPPQTHNQKSRPPQKITATTTTNHSRKTIPTNPQSRSHHKPMPETHTHKPTPETHTHKPTELNSFNHTHYTESPPVDHKPIATTKPTTQNFNPLPTAAVSHQSHRWQ